MDASGTDYEPTGESAPDAARLVCCARRAIRLRTVLLAALLCVPIEAVADTSSLSWVRLDGAERCIAAPDLARAVESRLGRPVFVPPGGADVAVEGRVEPHEAGFRAVLQLAAADGSPLGDRVVDSADPTCEELGRAVTTVLALMLDPLTAPPPVELPPVLVPDPPADTPRWRFDLDGTLSGGLGVVPGVALGGRGAFTIDAPGFVPIVAYGELVPFARADDAGGTFDFARAVGGLAICPLAARSDGLAAWTCAGLDTGAMFAVKGADGLGDGERVLVSGRASASARARLVGPVHAVIGVHAIVPLRRAAFTLASEPATVVYRPLAIGGAVDLGFGLGF